MLQIQRQMDSRMALRLMHDMSPETDDSSGDDEETLAAQREAFILSCLAQSTINNNNSINHVSQTTCSRTHGRQASITETYAKLELKQHHFEQINNQINEQHLYKMLEGPHQNINQLNNNFLQSCSYEEDSSDKENIKPRHTGSGAGSEKPARRPRKLPDVPRKPAQGPIVQLKPRVVNNEKCLADELQEALTRPNVDRRDAEDDDYFQTTNTDTQIVYPKYSCKFLEELKNVRFNAVSKNTRAYLNSDNMYLKEDSCEQDNCDQQTTFKSHDVDAVCSGTGGDEGGDDFRRTSSCFPSKNYQELVVTHRGMHRFIPRHKDELAIEIGDPIHVVRTDDDLWCEGVNLRSNQRGIFPSMYATDLAFLEEEEDDNGSSKFFLRFLGSVEVNYHKGDEVLCQAINKVALSRRAVKTSLPPPVCTLEVSQYGVRMLDKSTSGHEDTETFTHFFALKNITFCGHHPRNERYFGFITKHPNQYRYACHVFLGEKSTRTVTDAMGQAFKRFYQEYMAFTHPTEDIYME